MVDPLKVMGFGRPADADPSRDELSSLDAETEKRLEELTEVLQRKIRCLEEEAKRLMGNSFHAEATQEERRQALESLSAARFELTKHSSGPRSYA